MLHPDGEETLQARYFARDEIRAIRCKPHVQRYLEAAYARQQQAQFEPPSWTPTLP